VNALHSGLFVATAFSITALPILGRILIDLGMTNHPIGVIAISSAAINDVVGWVLLAVVTALTTAQFSAASFAFTLVLIAFFFIASWYVVRPLTHKILNRIEEKTARDFSDLSLGFLLSLIFLAGLCTYLLGIFAIFGGFMMGVILHDRERLVQAWRERMGQFVGVFFLPIFFTYTGLRTNIGGLASLELWALCLLVIALACLAKFLPVLLASRMAGHTRVEAKQLGILMNTRALMELIVINIGFDLKVISQNLFTMLVLMAIVSTVVTTPMMRRWMKSPSAA
jgi:Kef-type K+ transport system membrane component KefB